MAVRREAIPRAHPGARWLGAAAGKATARPRRPPLMAWAAEAALAAKLPHRVVRSTDDDTAASATNHRPRD